MLTDSLELRALLRSLLPGLAITSVPNPSGQRVVFFCRFDAHAVGKSEPRQRAIWGNVVLKVSQGIHAAQIAYLQKEIEILNSLNSIHYPKLYWYETFTIDPRTGDMLPCRLFVTIEDRINANPLSAVTSKHRSETQVLAFLDHLVVALQPLWNHAQKLIHRDLKPDNILIKADGTVVIIDLGIVREEGAAGLTATGNLFGPCTALYASPEQARNDKKNITFKSDFFSIGVLAYELIANEHPFGLPTESILAVLERVMNHTPPSLYKRKMATREFSDFVSKLMEKQPYRRQRTLEQLQQDLSSLIKRS